MDTEKRIPSLDGVRAVAIGLVIYWHLWLPTHLWLPSKPRIMFDWGTLGVYIFFVLSGYLITTMLLREFAATQSVSLKDFYTRRFFRIIPPLLFLLLGVEILDQFVPPLASVKALIFSLFFLRNYHPGPLVFQHLWSLSVEEQFYLMWPFLLARLSRRTVTRLLVTVIVIVPIVRLIAVLSIGDKYVWHTEQVGDGLAWGCLLALWQPQLRANRLYQRFSRSWATLFLPCIIAAGIYYYPLSVNALIGKSAVFFCVALAIDLLILRCNSPVGRLFNLPPVAWLGKLSYSLYLWQQIFLIARPKLLGWFPLNLVISLACAAVSYYLVEQPAIRLGRSIIALRRNAVTLATVGVPAAAEPGT